jgi:cytochrome bd-type quinol oxidase subunit 2
MKNVKQILYGATATALAIAPLTVGAQFKVPDDGTAGLKNTSIFAILTTFMNWLLGLVGVLAVIAFVISGILYLTAAGNEEQVEKAKNVMFYAIIGLVVALIGLIVVNAIAGLTGAAGASKF